MPSVRPRRRVGPETAGNKSHWHKDVKLELCQTSADHPELPGQVVLDFRKRISLRCLKSIKADVSLLPRAFFEAYSTARSAQDDLRKHGQDLISKLEDSTRVNEMHFGRCKLRHGKHGQATVTMEPFLCTLIEFPKILPDPMGGNKPKRRATEEELLVIACMLLEMTLQTTKCAGGTEDHHLLADKDGTCLIHALLLSNDPAALLIAYHMFKVRPELMVFAHEYEHNNLRPGDNRLRESPFFGENCLHIAVINGREALACRMLHLANERLGSMDENRLCTSQAKGSFFAGTGIQDGTPLACYGGTPLAFCACCDMKRALNFMVRSTIASPLKQHLVNTTTRRFTPASLLHQVRQGQAHNLVDHACELTGFHVIHAVTAVGSTTMLDVLLRLVSERAGKKKFDMLTMKTKWGEKEEKVLKQCLRGVRAIDTTGKLAPEVEARLTAHAKLTPLQLAVKLGNALMFKHLMRKQTKVLWNWGPLRRYEINLVGIDTLKDGCDVMALVTKHDAVIEAKEMLLDDPDEPSDTSRNKGCMQGFLFTLFEEKWKKFARRVYWILLLVDMFHLVLLCYVIFALKVSGDLLSAPHSADKGSIEQSRWATLLLLVVVAIELCEEFLAALNFWMERNLVDRGVHSQVRGLCYWLWTNHVLIQVIASVSTIIAVSILLSVETGPRGDEAPIDVSTSPLWVTLSLAAIFQSSEIVNHLLAPYPAVGIYVQVIRQMLWSDISRFMVLFTGFVLMFWLAMCTVYPNTATTAVPAFNGNPISALISLFTLATVGETLEINLFDEYGALGHDRQPWLEFDIALFIVYYILFIFLVVILLLNLLIAMMGRTYGRMEDEAIIRWRTDFARRVRRLELLSSSALCCCIFDREDLHAGEPKEIRGNKTIHVFKKTVRLKPDSSGQLVDLHFFGSEEKPIGEEALEEDNEMSAGVPREKSSVRSDSVPQRSDSPPRPPLVSVQPSGTPSIGRPPLTCRRAGRSGADGESVLEGGCTLQQTEVSEYTGEGKHAGRHFEPIYDPADARSTIKMMHKEGQGDDSMPKQKKAPRGYPQALLQGADEEGRKYVRMRSDNDDPDKWTGLRSRSSSSTAAQYAHVCPPDGKAFLEQQHEQARCGDGTGMTMLQIQEIQRIIQEQMQQMQQMQQPRPLLPPVQVRAPVPVRQAPIGLAQAAGNGYQQLPSACVNGANGATTLR